MRRILGIVEQLFVFATVVLITPATMAGGTGTIHGTVVAGSTPIVGATVRLLDLDRATRTDVNGEFTFLKVPAGAYRVFVREIGYTSEMNEVRVADTVAATSFALRESAIEAGEIVVSASPSARPADELYQSAESRWIIPLHQNPGSSFAEKISDLTGVAVRSNGSAPSRPMLRGLSDNRVLILENGLRNGDISTYDPAHAVPIEAEAITQVDVVRGPASVLYGPSTIGGLVNVFTETIPATSSRAFSGNLSLSGNTVCDEFSGFFHGVYSNAGHAFGISGGGLHAQDIRIPPGTYVDPASGHGFELSRMPQTFNHVSEAGVGYSYQGDFGMVGIGGKHYEMNYGIPGVPPNPDWADIPPATSRIAQKKNTVEVRGLLVVDDPFVTRLRLNANYVDYNHGEYPTAQDSTGVSDPQANHFHKRQFNGVLQADHRLSDGLRGTIGLWANVENLTIDGDQPLGPNSVTTGIAGYIFEEIAAAEDTRLQLGLRYDYNRIHANPSAASTDSVFQTLDAARLTNAATASLGVIQTLSPELTASLSLARSFRPPTVQELFADGLDAASATYSKGDARLGAETGFGIDASLRGSLTDLSFEISPYLNFINNYIYAFLTGDTLLDFPVRQFSATNARLMGCEVSISAEPLQNWGIRASLDYVHAQDVTHDVPLPFTPPMRGLLRVTYRERVCWGRIEWRMAARQSRLGDGDTPTPGYGVVNVGTGIRLAAGGVVHNIGLHCDNLFNRAYRDNLSVAKDFLPQPALGVRLTYDLLF